MQRPLPVFAWNPAAVWSVNEIIAPLLRQKTFEPETLINLDQKIIGTSLEKQDLWPERSPSLVAKANKFGFRQYRNAAFTNNLSTAESRSKLIFDDK